MGRLRAQNDQQTNFAIVFLGRAFFPSCVFAACNDADLDMTGPCY